MNLYEAAEILAKGKSEYFTIKNLLSLAIDVCIDPEAYNNDNQLHPISPFSNLSDNSVAAGAIQKLLQSTTKSCTDCSRREGCTNVVAGEGSLLADVFVVSDYPELIDDRTGLPLSGGYELKSSNCIVCSKFEECYTDFSYRESPRQPCSFIMSTNNLEDMIIFPNEAVKSPGTLLSTALTNLSKGGPSKVLTFRPPWEVYFKRLLDKEDSRPWVEALASNSKLYVTNLVKCKGDLESWDTSLSSCIAWTLLERRLCNAKITLALGARVASAILKETVEDITSLLNEVREVEGWGTVIFCEHPRDLLKLDQPIDRSASEPLERRIRWAINQTSPSKEVEMELEDE